MSRNQEIIDIIEKSFLDIKGKVKQLKKLKGQEKVKQIDIMMKSDFKKLRNLVKSYEIAIATMDSKEESNQHQVLLSQFEKMLDSTRKDLEYSRRQNMTEQLIFAHRTPKRNQQGNRQQMIEECFDVQQNDKERIKFIMKDLYEGLDIVNSTNVELQRQMEQLDKIYDTVRDTQTVTDRALKHIAYFARSVYTDKCLMVLIVIIIIAIVVVIILSAMGKTGGSATDISPI